MSGKAIDISDQTFGLLKAIKPIYANNAQFWECKCVCGRIRNVRAALLRNGSIFKCGKCTKHPSWKGYEEISGQYFASIKNSAIKRQLSFSITIQEIWDLFIKQNRKCALTGLILKFSEVFWKPRSTVNSSEQTASLDRINSKEGYSMNNVQWIHKDLQWMKGTFVQNKFINYCCLIADNFRKNNEITKII